MRKEFYLVKTLDHPGIVKAYEMEIDNLKNTVSISFEKIEGKTVKQIVSRKGPFK
jgi:serine/threonine protein kinase